MADGVRDARQPARDDRCRAPRRLGRGGRRNTGTGGVLRAVGVEKGQGFLWSRALSTEELIARYQSEHASDDVPQAAVATPP